MTIHVNFINIEKSNTFRMDMSPEEYLKLTESKTFDGINTQVVSILGALFRPLRTDKKFFWKDLLLPTTTQQVIKISELSRGVFATVLALSIGFTFSVSLDILTLPIRILSGIDLLIAERFRPDHPLKSYLKNNGADERSFAGGKIYVDASTIDKDGKKIILLSKYVNLIPRYRPAESFAERICGAILP